jgi:putative transposase
MKTNKTAAEYRLSHWAGIMRDRQESGLSVRAYCKTAAYHENTYFYWQRKLREKACQELIPIKNKENRETIPDGWTAVREADTQTANSDSVTVCIEIGKCRLTIASDINPNQLERICRVLKTL